MGAFLKKARINLRSLHSLSQSLRLPGETNDPILSMIFWGWLKQDVMMGGKGRFQPLSVPTKLATSLESADDTKKSSIQESHKVVSGEGLKTAMDGALPRSESRSGMAGKEPCSLDPRATTREKSACKLS